MRLRITLKTKIEQCIPINYQHSLTGVIYKLLSKSNLEFSNSLHSGNHINEKKKFKFFTFSWLQIPNKKIINSTFKILSPQITWYISSPWNEFIQYLVNGLLDLGEIRVGSETFSILQVETLPEPFNKVNEKVIEQKFTFFSPFVITTKKEFNGKLKKYYYKNTDSQQEISEKIQQNLINKYRLFYQKDPINDLFEIKFDTNYWTSPKSQVLSHYIKQDKNISGELDIKIPALMCPFTLTSSTELARFAYECGFGELNSSGFGMVKMV